MKTRRQEKILELIEQQDVETQEQLQKLLQAAGFACTQATVSRDIKELRIVKELSRNGTYRYARSTKETTGVSSMRLNAIFRESVSSCEQAQNLVVIRTLPGMANGACFAIDGMALPNVVGTLAGDDTGLIIMRDNLSAAAFCAEIKSMLRGTTD